MVTPYLVVKERRPLSSSAVVFETLESRELLSFTVDPLHWKSVATNPLKREEAQSAVYNGKLYEFGGYHDHFQASRRVDVYDPAKNKWTRLHDMPYSITHAAVAPDPDGHSFWF